MKHLGTSQCTNPDCARKDLKIHHYLAEEGEFTSFHNPHLFKDLDATVGTKRFEDNGLCPNCQSRGYEVDMIGNLIIPKAASVIQKWKENEPKMPN
jgi:hypothetical protein